MKIFRYTRAGQTSLGLCHPQDVTRFVNVKQLLPQAPMPTDVPMEMLFDAKLRQTLQAAQQRLSEAAYEPMSVVQLDVPLPRPPKIICMGLNYADHAKEGGNARPEYPSFFMRGATSLVAHQSPIVRPKVSDKLDYEAELAVVVGQGTKHLTADNALDCVFGYTCFNDGSLRDYQRKTGQWTIGKNFDATGGFGPWVVTADELPAGAEGLRIQSRLNGQVMQDANTRDFLWNVREALIIISECMTLEAGDVIITGTPAGVGYARTPPVWMQPGDVCEIEIDGIGVLRNPISQEV